MAGLVRVDIGRGYLFKVAEADVEKFIAAHPGAKVWERGNTSTDARGEARSDKFFPPEPDDTEVEGIEDGEGEGVEVPLDTEVEADLTARKPKK